MRKNNIKYFLLLLLFFHEFTHGQNWRLKLKSKIELRNWTLTSKAIKHETFLNGAEIKLYQGSNVVSQTTSDSEGNFEVNIPPNGSYTLMITYADCNPKKFTVNTKSVPEKKNDPNFKPSIDITGFIMSKPIKGVNYLGLNQPLVTVEYNKSSNGFANTGETNTGIELESKIYDAEYKVIQKFCTANKLGDIALDNKDFSLAKTYYLTAMNIMDGESYPKERLKKAEEGLKEEKTVKSSIAIARNNKKSKAKTSASKQNIVAKPARQTNFKKSSDHKSGRKIAKPL